LDGDDEEDLERKRRGKKQRKPAKTIFDIFDPFELEKGHYTDLDQEIRTTDIPERMQLRQVPVTTVPDDSDELDREAKWIYNEGFIKPTVSRQSDYLPAECDEWKKKSATTEKIKKALDFMRQQFLEVPFIAFYRKEYVHPELENINSLWRVYHMDEKWCQIQTRKRNIKRLFEKTKTWQTDCVMADTQADLPEGMVMIPTEELCQYLDDVKTVDDVKDIYQHFLLYWGRYVGDCQEFHRQKLKDEKKERRERRLEGKMKKYKTVKRKIKRKVTKTVTKTVTETVENEETGEPEEVEKEVEEEVETEVESEVDEEVTDDEAMLDDPEEEEEEEDDDQDEETIKYAKRNDAYALAVKFKLSGLASSFGLTPREFGENLSEGYAKNEIGKSLESFEDTATAYMNEKLDTLESVMKAVVFMVATQLSKQPEVRKTVRAIFYEKATVTLRPTAKGTKEIGEEHEMYAMKYLHNKPVTSFKNEEFLLVMSAVDDKLIDMEIGENLMGVSEGALYTAEAVDLYREDYYTAEATEWNRIRKEAVELAFNKMIYPQLRKELINKLKAEAVDGIKRSCQRTVCDWIKWAPYKIDWEEEFDEDDWDASGGCRILGISYSSDTDESSFAALISAEGELADYLRLPYLMAKTNSWQEKERLGKIKDMESLANMIRHKRPHGLALCTEDANAKYLLMDLQAELARLTSEDESFPPLRIFHVDSNLAKVYANTNKSNNDFREHPVVLKQAISIARRLQDPLVEFSGLCNAENDILCLRYHPKQDLIGEEQLLDAIYQEFINVVNKVGVDINECVAHPHTNNLVQFIGGLGARKGASLLKTLRGMSNPRLENRQQLVTSCHMGPKVFINCAGFVKIDTTALGDSEQYIEVLDGSRIHNEAYEWARKMAVDALEYDDDEEEGNPASAVEDILREPEKLDELNLDAFAEELERQGFGNKQITLYDIRAELNDMYGERRVLFVEPGPEDIFDMTNKETPETFYIGKLMQAQVSGFQYKRPEQEELDSAAPMRNAESNLWECPFCGKNDFPELTEVWNHFDAVDECPGKCNGVNVRLENGISGFIFLGELSDSPILRPDDRVKIRQNIYVRITKINAESGRVHCTSRTSALRDIDGVYRQQKDEFYDQDAEKKDQEKEEKTAKAKQTQYIKRVVVHPHFHNIPYKEAEKLMAQMDQGDVIIRPSSKGKDNLSCSWKVTDNIYQHIDIREEDKENAFSLGKKLIINHEEFEDLDEIIARHINPMASHTRDILNFKNYKDTQGDKQIAEEWLLKEKKGNNTRIPYLLHPSKQFAGKFLLSYCPRNKARHEFVSVTPDGFRFRKQNHDTLNLLMKWFKEHFREPVPGTPMASPAVRGNRTPYGTGRTTPGQRPGITPGAMSMAGTPYGGTPSNRHNAPYTPTANTPFMTPVHTPGGTPRGYGGGTPKAGFPGSTTPRSVYGGGTPRGGGHTPGQNTPSYRQSSSGNAWAAAAESWASGRRTPSGKGYSTTPRYDQDPRLTPKYGGGGGRTPQQAASGSRSMPPPQGGRPPAGRTPTHGGRTPTHGGGGRTPQYGSGRSESGRTPGTPRGQFGDSTPLYDE